MASLTLLAPLGWVRLANRLSVAVLAPHAVMAIAMVFAMVGGHSVLRMLAAAAALILTSIVCARRARSEPLFRDHLVDLWGMACLLIALALAHDVTSPSAHEHLFLPHGVSAVIITMTLWLAARVILARGRGRHAIASASLSAVALTAMAVFCT